MTVQNRVSRIPMIALVAAATLFAAPARARAAGEQGPSQEIGPAWQAEQDRQFDFWVGRWDVNLRIRQPDNSWKDSKSAEARIYRILDGKAILELWDEKVEGPGIRGYSLRHYDPDRGEWILYLNWPGENRSGTQSLSGSFRHGRGEFFSTRKGQDGTEILQRYTFCDVSPTSLRWDDGYSSDGGKTWSGNWIMEFTRAADRATWPAEGEKAHTFHTGARCSAGEFRPVEILAGRRTGQVTVHDGNGAPRSVPASLLGYKVLDGCAVLAFLEYERAGAPFREFRMLTWNTYADVYEETVLDNQPGTPVRLMYGPRLEDGSIRIRTRKDVHPARRNTWSVEPGGGLSIREEESTDGDTWSLRREGSFGG